MTRRGDRQGLSPPGEWDGVGRSWVGVEGCQVQAALDSGVRTSVLEG